MFGGFCTLGGDHGFALLWVSGGGVFICQIFFSLDCFLIILRCFRAFTLHAGCLRVDYFILMLSSFDLWVLLILIFMGLCSGC